MNGKYYSEQNQDNGKNREESEKECEVRSAERGVGIRDLGFYCVRVRFRSKQYEQGEKQREEEPGGAVLCGGQFTEVTNEPYGKQRDGQDGD